MRWFSMFAMLAACHAAPPTTQPGWMTPIDDAVLLSDLSIPGTHESAALHEPVPGTAKCQNLTLDAQLQAGVRYFDIRTRHLDDAFSIFHGPVSELQTFDDVLATFSEFLDTHPTETAIMSIKEESQPGNVTRSFEDTFASYVAKDPDRWYLGASVPALGDVRGKIVLLRRFAATASPLGFDAAAWGDDTTFTLTTGDSMLRVQDAYHVSSDDTKWMAIDSLLTEAAMPVPGTLYLNYTSGYQTHSGLPDTPSVALTINDQLDTFLADPANANAHLGVLAMDLVSEARVAAVAATNSY